MDQLQRLIEAAESIARSLDALVRYFDSDVSEKVERAYAAISLRQEKLRAEQKVRDLEKARRDAEEAAEQKRIEDEQRQAAELQLDERIFERLDPLVAELRNQALSHSDLSVIGKFKANCYHIMRRNIASGSRGAQLPSLAEILGSYKSPSRQKNILALLGRLKSRKIILSVNESIHVAGR